MAEKRKRGFWRTMRRLFRWCRISVWLLVFALLVVFVYMDRVGLPQFAREPLLAALRERGMELQFSRLRLVWYRGVVADEVDFGQRGERPGLRAAAHQAEVHVRFLKLLLGELDVAGVALRGGSVTLPVWGTNDTSRELNFQKVSGELRFRENDRWDLDGLRAEAFGVRLMLGGSITNASAIRDWKFAQRRPDARTPAAFWHNLIAQLEQTRFHDEAQIIGAVSGDARDLATFRANLTISSPTVESPWGKGDGLKLNAAIAPEPGELIRADVKLEAQNAVTRWGQAEALDLEAQVTPSLTQWTPTNAVLRLQVKRARTLWANAATLALAASFRPNPSDAASSLAEYTVRGQQIQTRWVRLAQAEFSAQGLVSSSNAWPRSAKTTLKFAGGDVPFGRASSGNIEADVLLPPLEQMALGNTNHSWWTRLDAISGNAAVQLKDVRSERFSADEFSTKASWQSPILSLRELSARLYNGTLQGAATLNATNREFSAELTSTVDAHRATDLLSTNVLRWLNQFTWETPPRLAARASVTLPVWTNGWTGVDWIRDVVPTVVVNGTLESGPVSFRGIPISALRSDLRYSNRVWHLPNLVLTRPEGQAHVAHFTDERTGRYQFVLDSAIDPRIVRPLLPPLGQKAVDEFAISVPPQARAEVSGSWRDAKSISARMTFAATNFSYREQPVVSARSLVTFTNLVLTFVQPHAVRAEGSAQADSVVVDIAGDKVLLNNATGSLHVAAVTRAILPIVEEVTAPYRFINAPHARVNGTIHTKDERRSDLRFELAGGPFEWRSFRFQQITGFVHWAGPSLLISNLVGSMHGGFLEGSMRFDFDVPRGAQFAFRTLVHNLNLNTLVHDMGSTNSKLEGSLSGLLVVTNANSEDMNSWFGHGNMMLQDGLIWDVPVFGLFSPVLNAIKPGAGNNRAKEATATFLITNSVFYTSDLRIHASGMRLNYDGTVDFDTRINGRMEAELFRDTPGVGQVVSKVFWPVTKLFEYRVTGTFSEPKSEPLYIPKVLMMPFHPLRTLRELIEGEEPGGR